MLTRAAGTVWVCSPWGHPLLPLGKTHFCSDPISSSLQGNQGDPGPPGPPVRSHLAPRAGDCHTRVMSARLGIPLGSRGGVALLGLSGPAAPSLFCATSKHHPNNVPLSPAGQCWPPRDPGPSWCQGKAAALASASALPCPAWQRGKVPCQIWGLEGGPRFRKFWAGGRDIWLDPLLDPAMNICLCPK